MTLSKRDLLLVLAVTVSWGIHTPIIRLGVLELDPFLLAFLRFALTGLIFLPFARRPAGKEWKDLFFVGVFFLIGNLGFGYLSLSYITANSQIVILQVAQPITLILAWVLFREKFGLWTTAGIAVAFSGLILVFGAPDILASPIGAFYAILGALFWSLGSVWMKKTGGIPPLTFLAYANLMMAPFMLGLTLIFESGQIDTVINARPGVVAFVLCYQVLLMGLMMMVWGGLMSRNPAQIVTPFLMLQPVFAVIASNLLLGETLDMKVFLGGLTVLAGIGLINWRAIVKRRKAAVTPV